MKLLLVTVILGTLTSAFSMDVTVKNSSTTDDLMILSSPLFTIIQCLTGKDLSKNYKSTEDMNIEGRLNACSVAAPFLSTTTGVLLTVLLKAENVNLMLEQSEIDGQLTPELTSIIAQIKSDFSKAGKACLGT